MNYCPCCSSKLLCHVNQQKIYWFCSNCGQEMPNLNHVNKKTNQVTQTNFPVLSNKKSAPY